METGGSGFGPEIEVERADGIYRTGEDVEFRIRPTQGKAPRGWIYRLSWDGEGLVRGGEVGSLPSVISYRPGQPGFLRISIHDSSKPGEPLSQAAVAVSPLEVPPSMPVPEDFAEFWQGQISEYLPEEVEGKTRRHSDTDQGRIFEATISLPRVGDVHGWLLKPHGRGPFPCVCRYHGAGVYPVPPENGLDLTSLGFMVLSINPHSIPNDHPLSYYEELQRGALADYRTRGREDRERLYFREMFLRAAGAVAFMRGQTDWDGDHLIIEGHSQGGGQALAAAALAGGEIDGLVVSCSTHCDHTGPVIGRVAGWPKIVEVRDGVPDAMQVEAARYIDGVNFASMIECPALFSVGFLDDTCPPTGIYAAYNSLEGPRKINNEVETEHVHTERFKEATYRWEVERIQ